MMEVTIDAGVREYWEDVMSDKTDTAWCTVGYEGKKLVPRGKGTGGRTECLESITSDSEIIFGGFRVTAVDDRENTVSRRQKFIFFMYRAENAAAMTKAKAGRHLGQLEQEFSGYHVMFQVDELYELSEANIVAKLRAAGGAHQPTGYDFGHGDVGEGAQEDAPKAQAAANPADAAPQNAKAPPATASPVENASAAAVQSASTQMSQVSISQPPDQTGQETCEAGQVLVLTTSTPSTTIVEGNQLSLQNIFKGKGVTAIKYLDGVLPENKELRTEMFELSGKRGVYPQVFIQDASKKLKFIGDFDEIQSLIDTDSLPAEVLDANPGIPSFTRAFNGFTKETAKGVQVAD